MAKHEATVANVLDDCFRRLLGKTGKTVKTKARLKKGEAQRLWKAGILGVGYGVKETAGGLTPVLGARVYVRHKRSLKSLNQGERIPEFVLEDSKSGEGLNTDVVAVPGLRPLNGDSDPGVLSSRGDSDSNGVLSTGSSWLVKDLAMLRSPHRPLTGGASVGPNLSAGDMAGTLGCFVKDSAGKTYILSNNHVLANSRLAGHEQDNEVQPDADIFQPGTLDWSEPYITDMLVHGSKQGDPVAKLAEVVPIQPSDPTVAGPPAENRVDAALARITPSANRQAARLRLAWHPVTEGAAFAISPSGPVADDGREGRTHHRRDPGRRRRCGRAALDSLRARRRTRQVRLDGEPDCGGSRRRSTRLQCRR